MVGKFALPFLETLEKVLTIVKGDADKTKVFDSETDIKAQFDCLMELYAEFDPNTAFEKINELEQNKTLLSDEIGFMLKMYAINARNLQHHPNRRFNFASGLRFEYLLNKYQLQFSKPSGSTGWTLVPIRSAFPDEEYKLKKENPNLCFGLPDEMKKYKNFKKEYNVEAIMALLPAGKKYGGFVKAFLNCQLHLLGNELPFMVMCGTHIFHVSLAKLRKSYNSTIYPNEKRLEWFEKLGIKEEDCALWSRLFDQQYAGYKDVHKLFGQVA